MIALAGAAAGTARGGAGVKVSLKALSAVLGLSRTTVSRALNGYDDVSEATRARVAAAAREMGYVADSAARRLATGRADVIGMIYPFGGEDLGDARFGEVVAGVTERLAEHELDFIVAAARPGAELETYRRLVDGKRIDGLIVARTLVDDPRIAYLRSRAFPFVAYGRTNIAQPYACFDFDNEAGARLAVGRLLGFGHRRIAMISAPLSFSFAAQRRAGFLAGLSEAGVPAEPELLVQSALSHDGGMRAAQSLLAREPRPTALLVDNNIAGAGAFRALVDSRLGVGSDISLIVYDGVSSDAALPRRVTAVIQPTGQETGRQLAELMLERLVHGTLSQRIRMPRIEAGDTDGPVASRA
ncbi:substrate-binding domain-containing protein [Burkholderia gladioli]